MGVKTTMRAEAPEALPAVEAGAVPCNILAPTGRLDAVLTAWNRGHLAEVPAGHGFDVLCMPGALARDAVERLRAAGLQTGPVILGPSGAEFILRLHSARRWDEPNSTLLRPGTLVLLPPPTAVCPERTVGGRGWLIPPAYHEESCPLGHGVTWGGDLLEPYRAAVKAAKKAEVAGR
ncbi:MAG TPA: hypothetical protein VK545_03470 [Streptomyces sp.]|nr:hypothetical protein [Streptomyces sp.]